MSRRADLLFLMTDHQRADSIGMVQAGIEVTPNLNRLAAEAVHFTRAYTTCPLCVPARTALATGRYPTANGVVTNDWQGVTAGDFPPVHQLLAEAGYRVAHLGVDHIRVNPPLASRVAFSRHLGMTEHRQWLQAQGINDAPPEGPGSYQRPLLENRGGVPTKAAYSSARAGLWQGPEAAFFDRWIGRQALAELQEASLDQPLAIFVYL
jgi:arylsulfatase A-like enzyme